MKMTSTLPAPWRCHLHANWFPSIHLVQVIAIGMDWPFVELWTGHGAS